MQWNSQKSMELKSKIAQNPELMEKLTRCVEKVFEEFKVELPGASFVFEPRIFSLKSGDAPELASRSRAAMLSELLNNLAEEAPGNSITDILDSDRFRACLPQCGPMDPISLKILEKLRIRDLVEDDPVPVRESGQLMRRITGNTKLLAALSKGLFAELEAAGITFGRQEGCVFTPIVFEAPVYAQKIGAVSEFARMEGFGPQIYAAADPTPEPAAAMRIKPFPGIIEVRDQFLVPGVIFRRWWWIGIPAPELLVALDRIREYR